MFLVTSDEINQMDQITINSFGIPERVLMENAGRSATTFFLELFQTEKIRNVGILAGWGNNGGDAFVIARYLSQKNISVTVFLLSMKNKIKSKAAVENMDLLISLGIPILEVPDIDIFKKLKVKFKNYDIWIDAIFGTGLKSSIEGFIKEVVNFVNYLELPVFSIDVPSGLNSNTGQICGVCVRAFATVAFAFAKVGHYIYPGADYTGKLKVVDIGIPLLAAKRVGCDQILLNFNNIKSNFFSRANDIHKGTNGHLLVVAGSPGKTGAAILASRSAIRSGAGLVTLCIPKSLNSIVETVLIEVISVGLPETILGDLDVSAFQVVANLVQDKNCVVFGPGIGRELGASLLLERLIGICSVPIVIDADGLNIIADSSNILANKIAPIVLTPHPREMARLIGKSVSQVQKDRVNVARNFAKKFDVHVVLKGANTVIAHPDGKIFINSTGNPGMASGGMGDVLSGMLAAFISQGYPVDFSARFAVYLHGLSGDAMVSLKGPYGYLATDIIENIPKQIALIHSDMSKFPLRDIDPLLYQIDK